MNPETTDVTSNLNSLVAEMRGRAVSTRRFAKFSILGIVCVVALMIAFFSTWLSYSEAVIE